MRPIRLRLLMGLLLAPRAASAETVDGSGALALAGLLGIVSPLLGAQEKDVLNKLPRRAADAGAGSVFETIGELDCKSIQRGDRERRRRRALTMQRPISIGSRTG